MDIRSFFGKKKSGGSGTPSSAAPKKKKALSASTASTSATSSRSNGSGGGNNNDGTKKRPTSSTSSSSKKALKDNNDSDSDTEMEDNDVKIVASNNNNGKKTKKEIRIDDSSDTEDESTKPKAKKARAVKSPHFTNSSSDDEGVALSKKSKQEGRSSPKKRKIAIDSDSEDDGIGNVDGNGGNGNDSGEDDDVDDYLEQAKKRRAAARAAASGGGSAKPAAKSPAKKRAVSKKKVIKMESSGEEEEEEIVKSDDEDASDDDFKPANNDSEDSEEEEKVKQSPKKRRAATSTSRTSPRRTSPRRKAALKIESESEEEEEEEVAPKRKASPKRKVAVKKEVKKQAVKKEEPSTGPPKYHPPSSKLTAHIPFLTSQQIKLSHSSHSLPKLPDNDPNFDIDSLVPHCLEGLTFVFSGILSTNDASTLRTNFETSLSSPTKGDYYANRQFDVQVGDANCELSRDTASDIVKSLGGRVTTAVSGKTDYLILGSILEDGRAPEEGSKYKKVVEIWSGWEQKWRGEYAAGATGGGGDDDSDSDNDDNGGKKQKGKGKGKKKTKAQLKDKDPNTLVEIVHGIREFYALCVYLSEWKKGTLSEEERREFEMSQAKPVAVKSEVKSEAVAVKSETKMKSEAKVKQEVKQEVKNEPSPSHVSNPYAAKTPVANPYASKPIANPYAKKSPAANPYAKKASPANNPYAKPAAAVSNPYMTNPYAKKAANPYASSSTAAASSSTTTTQQTATKSNNIHKPTGQKLCTNSLWADKYAPSTSREILGNADSVNKLVKWLNGWEGIWNDSKGKKKGFTNPGGPWKAALLSGPPGIGKTTTATLVAKESGRDVLELNASDARSKKALGQALGDVTGSQVLSFDNMGSNKKKKRVEPQKRCIIMDEVDGMGAGDRSGMSELIQMIKKSKVPIICICNDRSSQKMKSLVQYCMDLRYRRPTKMVIARRAVEIGRLEGMQVEINAAEAMAESCGNDIRQVLNSLQMWSCKKKGSGASANVTYRDLKERQGEINKDEVLRVSMFDACRSIVEGSRGLAGADAKAVNASIYKRTDAFFVDYMLMGLMVHQNYLKVAQGQFNGAKMKDDEDAEFEALNSMYKATEAMSDFGMCEESLRGGDQNWALLPLCSVLAVKVGHHAGGPMGGMLPGYPEFAGWLGKNSSRNKKIRLLQELRRHMNYKVSADASELRMNYLPIMRQQFEQLLFDKEGARVTEAIELMDEYGLDRDDVFENFDEFLFNSKDVNKGIKKFGELDTKSKTAFTRAYNSMAHKAQALVAEQGAEKTGRKKGGGNGGEMGGGAELDVVDDDKAAAAEDSDEEDEEDLEALKKKFLKKGRGKAKAGAAAKKKSAPKATGKKGKKK